MSKTILLFEQTKKKKNFTVEKDVASISETPTLKYLKNEHIKQKECKETHYNEAQGSF